MLKFWRRQERFPGSLRAAVSQPAGGFPGDGRFPLQAAEMASGPMVHMTPPDFPWSKGAGLLTMFTWALLLERAKHAPDASLGKLWNVSCMFQLNFLF